MRSTGGIRHRVLSILLLGIVTSALSLFGLARILSVTSTQRLERARDSVTEEIDRLAARPSAIKAGVPEELPRFSAIGVRGGYVPRGVGRVDEAPASWREPLAAALAESAARGSRILTNAKLGDATLVVCAQPGANSTIAWAALLVAVPPYLRIWQAIVILLALATTLLVATSIYATVTFKRGASAINASLVALASDLDAPIPRPPLRELGEIADGVADLAHSLAKARAAQEELGKALGEQERLAALGRVVAGVAHEVRNPLASIKLRLDLAAATADLPEPLASAIAHASSEIARLDRLVADLLVVSGRAVGPMAHLSVGELVRGRVDALGPWAASKEVTIRVHGDAKAPIDADSLGRAIDNVVRNAVEASPTGGVVDVHVATNGHGARVCVEDRGEGVAPERALELFEPFFTTKSEGTGLGLAISRAIARAHGGDVSYARDGSITRFEIAIDTPRRAAQGEARA